MYFYYYTKLGLVDKTLFNLSIFYNLEVLFFKKLINL